MDSLNFKKSKCSSIFATALHTCSLLQCAACRLTLRQEIILLCVYHRITSWDMNALYLLICLLELQKYTLKRVGHKQAKLQSTLVEAQYLMLCETTYGYD